MPEAVIVAAARSPIGRAYKGSLTGMRADDLAAAMVRVGEIFAVPLELHVDRIIGEGDCVAMEAHSTGTLHSGAHYRNRYHYLFEFAPDGRIRRINEHMDSKHAYEVMGAPPRAAPAQ